MNILVNSAVALPVGPKMSYQGCERLAYEYAQHLAQLGHQVTLLACQESIAPPSTELIISLQGGAQAELATYPRYKDRLKEFDAILDLSHYHAPAMGEPNLPCLNIFWHDPLIAKYPEPSYNMVAISQYAAEGFKLIYGQEALHQETIEVDPSIYCPGEYSRRDGRFLSVGKMSVEKGNLEAMRICRKVGVGLDVVGGRMPTDSDNYELLVHHLATGDIKCWGNCSDEVKIGLMRSAKALIYPLALLEIHSHKSVEAILCGCPVVTYNLGAMSEVIGPAGFVVNTEEEFISSMERVGEIDSSLCREYGMKWSREKIVGGYAKLLEQVANGKRW